MLLSGCGRINCPALPDEAIAFEMGTFEDIEQDDNTFGTIEYNGRTYIGYGTVNNSYKLKSIGDCLGYIIQDENSGSVYEDPQIVQERLEKQDFSNSA